MPHLSTDGFFEWSMPDQLSPGGGSGKAQVRNAVLDRIKALREEKAAPQVKETVHMVMTEVLKCLETDPQKRPLANVLKASLEKAQVGLQRKLSKRDSAYRM